MPMVSVCWKHRTLLHSWLTSRGKLAIELPSQQNENQWLHDRAVGDVPAFESPAPEAQQFAMLSHALLLSESGFSPDRLLRCYRNELYATGALNDMRVSFAYMEVLMERAVRGIVGARDLGPSRRWLQLVLHNSSPDPRKHLMLVLALFGTWERFLDAYKASDEDSSPVRLARSVWRRPVDEDAIKAQSRAPGATAAGIARDLGVSSSTVRVRCNRMGVVLPSRPRPNQVARTNAIQRALMRCESFKEIAERERVSTSTVSRVARSSLSISALRQSFFEERERNIHRSTLNNFLTSTCISSRADLRARKPALYAWLLHHDRRWFAEALPPLKLVDVMLFPSVKGALRSSE